jgi:hypothetical protein
MALAAVAGTTILGADPPESTRRQQAFRSRVVAAERLSRSGQAAPAKRGFSPAQVTGPPDVRQAGDNSQAWASQTPDGQKEWLLCEYAEALEARAIIVYETFNPGALVQVSAFNADGDEIVAWEGNDPTPRGKPKGISVIPVKLDFPVKRIRLSIDSPAVPGWNEIDAVAIEDRDGNTHWAVRAEASSVYGSPGAFDAPANTKPSYSPLQATGEPDTPRPGDQGTAWASATSDGQPEWLLCEFKAAKSPIEIVVYENNAPGAITKIGVFKDDDTEVTAWEGTDPTPRDQPWGVSVFPVKLDFPFKKLKLYINSQEVPGYNEVDAVGLRTAGGETEWASAAQASSAYGAANQGANVMLVDPVVPQMADRNLRELQKEVQELRKEVEELRQLKKELKELQDRLKDAMK